MSRKRRLVAAFLLTTGVTLAQVDGVSVTVTQSVSAQPTLADFRINAVTDPSVSLDQMVERLQCRSNQQELCRIAIRRGAQFANCLPVRVFSASDEAQDDIGRTRPDRAHRPRCRTSILSRGNGAG
jgi:hypothetical protein